MFEGSKYARRMEFRAIWVDVDSLVIANCINKNGNESPVGRSLVERILRLISLDWDQW